MADEIDETAQEPAPKASDFLKADLGKARAESKALKAQMAKYEGIDVDEYFAMREAIAKQKEADSIKRGEFDEIIQAERSKALAAEGRALEAIAKANESLVQANLSAAFVAAGGKAEHAENFTILAKAKLAKNEQGEYVIPDTVVDAKGEPVTDWQGFATHARDNGLGFAFNPVSGSAGSGKIGGNAPSPTTIKTVSPAEANSYIAEIAAGTVVVG